MSSRFAIDDIDPEAYKPMYATEKYIHSGDLSEELLALVKTRASQLNACAFCLDMHATEGRNAGVDQRKLDVLAGWREAPGLYTSAERAALALTEEVTRIGQDGVSDAVWHDVAELFGQAEHVRLLMAICAINTWNRMAVATHQELPER